MFPKASVHLGGYSSGGAFTHYAAARLNDILASISPVSSTPFMGFGEVPLDPPISLIEFNGLLGRTPSFEMLIVCSSTSS